MGRAIPSTLDADAARFRMHRTHCTTTNFAHFVVFRKRLGINSISLSSSHTCFLFAPHENSGDGGNKVKVGRTAKFPGSVVAADGTPALHISIHCAPNRHNIFERPEGGRLVMNGQRGPKRRDKKTAVYPVALTCTYLPTQRLSFAFSGWDGAARRGIIKMAARTNSKKNNRKKQD